MSRHELDPYAYGFDRPMAQYFLSKGRKQIVGPLSKVYGTNYALIDALKKEGIWGRIPMEHKRAIQGDLPF